MPPTNCHNPMLPLKLPEFASQPPRRGSSSDGPAASGEPQRSPPEQAARSMAATRILSFTGR
jgi:hypothetical protein